MAHELPKGADTAKSRWGRRDFLKTAGAGIALSAPFIGRAEAATPTLRLLMWESYLLPDTVSEFEEKYGARIAPQFFDGNSEAFNKMKAGGTSDFDIVMADGFWPRLYMRDGLIQPMKQDLLPNLSGLFDAFKPETYELLHDAGSGDLIGVENCWGDYGITMNADQIDAADQNSLNVVFDEKYAGHLSSSARFEENIALAGILAATELGTKDGPRPGGGTFNPYDLTDEELARVKELLIRQKKLLVSRYTDYDGLERLMRPGLVWASPEFTYIYRKLKRAYRAGEIGFDVAHVMRPKEGGLGWVDSWQVSSGTTNSEVYELAHHWINSYISIDNMTRVAKAIEYAPCYDVRTNMSDEENELLMLDQTSDLEGLYMFDQPSSPEKWERVWSEVEAA